MATDAEIEAEVERRVAVSTRNLECRTLHTEIVGMSKRLAQIRPRLVAACECDVAGFDADDARKCLSLLVQKLESKP